jgi:hypothetical protein
MTTKDLISCLHKQVFNITAARDSSIITGDITGIFRYETELAEAQKTLNGLLAIDGQAPITVDGANLDALAEVVAERLRPSAETIPEPLKETLKATISLLDTVSDGDGVKFFGKGLTDEKKLEVESVRDGLTRFM